MIVHRDLTPLWPWEPVPPKVPFFFDGRLNVIRSVFLTMHLGPQLIARVLLGFWIILVTSAEYVTGLGTQFSLAVRFAWLVDIFMSDRRSYHSAFIIKLIGERYQVSSPV